MTSTSRWALPWALLWSLPAFTPPLTAPWASPGSAASPRGLLPKAQTCLLTSHQRGPPPAPAENSGSPRPCEWASTSCGLPGTSRPLTAPGPRLSGHVDSPR